MKICYPLGWIAFTKITIRLFGLIERDKNPKGRTGILLNTFIFLFRGMLLAQIIEFLNFAIFGLSQMKIGGNLTLVWLSSSSDKNTKNASMWNAFNTCFLILLKIYQLLNGDLLFLMLCESKLIKQILVPLKWGGKEVSSTLPNVKNWHLEMINNFVFPAHLHLRNFIGSALVQNFVITCFSFLTWLPKHWCRSGGANLAT